MRVLVPDKRWRDLRAALNDKILPQDPITRSAYLHVTGEAPDEQMQYVLDLIDTPEDRERLTAFFLSRATKEEISNATWIPLEILTLFEQLVIDPATFRNKLEWLRYIEDYKHGCSPYAQRLIQAGVSIGPGYLIYMHSLGHEDITLDSKEIIRTMMNEAFHLGMSAKATSITSSASKEAFKWLGKAHQLADSAGKFTEKTHNSDDAALFELVERRSNFAASSSTDDIISQGKLEAKKDANTN